MKTLQTKDGKLDYCWRTDLEQECGENYIPVGYSKRVLQLEIIKVKCPGNGHGAELMQAFLNTADAKRAELIFLDPTAGIGVNRDSKVSEAVQIKRLIKFYKRYGFKRNPKSTRMWLDNKGLLRDNELPM